MLCNQTRRVEPVWVQSKCIKVDPLTINWRLLLNWRYRFWNWLIVFEENTSRTLINDDSCLPVYLLFFIWCTYPRWNTCPGTSIGKIHFEFLTKICIHSRYCIYLGQTFFPFSQTQRGREAAAAVREKWTKSWNLICVASLPPPPSPTLRLINFREGIREYWRSKD
jgi:hypothetical protein